MKRFIFILTVALAAMTFASCQKTEPDSLSPGNVGQPTEQIEGFILSNNTVILDVQGNEGRIVLSEAYGNMGCRVFGMNGSFVSVNTEKADSEGSYVIIIKATHNKTGNERSHTLTVTDGLCMDTITVIQESGL